MMKEYTQTGSITKAANKAGLSPKTARKWKRTGLLPSEAPKKPRSHRTRVDPFADIWDNVVPYLKAPGKIDAKALFQKLQEDYPGRWGDGAVRTFQRRVNEWRGKYGPYQEIFFPQEHIPGEAMQLDFTCIKELNITIAGEKYGHLLCHVVLPYSNWEWGTLAKSEALLALKLGFQAALFQLGKTPEFIQTDNSTAATHVVGAADASPAKEGRAFNKEYLNMCEEFGIKPRTIAIACKEQNGDVESSHNHLKHALRNALVLRGNSEFLSLEELEVWIENVMRRRNMDAKRQERLKEELKNMKPIRAERLPEYVSYRTKVSKQSTVSIKYNVYSVPSRLIKREVEVRIYEWNIEIHFAGELIIKTERLVGKCKHKIDYHHVIDSLLRKPGAFKRYRYQADMFPRECFREIYEKLSQNSPGIQADVEYLRILHLAAYNFEDDVAIAIRLVLDNGGKIDAESIKQLVIASRPITSPSQQPLSPDLSRYDRLLLEVA
jgi:hypothetical protein